MSNPKCVGYPGLYPWLITDSGNPSLLTWERNPYYFKVDTQGQQLPYIDKLASTQVNDMEAITLKILAGDVDFQRESTALVKMPLYKENDEKAGFRIQLLDMHVDSSSLRVNQTFKDDKLAERCERYPLPPGGQPGDQPPGADRHDLLRLRLAAPGYRRRRILQVRCRQGQRSCWTRWA